MSASVVISKPGTLTAFRTRRIWLNGVVFDSSMIVSRQIALFTATDHQLPRAPGCGAFTKATPRTNGDSQASRFSKNSGGIRLNNTVINRTKAMATNQPAAWGGTSTVTTMMTSAAPSLSRAGKRDTRSEEHTSELQSRQYL